MNRRAGRPRDEDLRLTAMWTQSSPWNLGMYLSPRASSALFSGRKRQTTLMVVSDAGSAMTGAAGRMERPPGQRHQHTADWRRWAGGGGLEEEDWRSGGVEEVGWRSGGGGLEEWRRRTGGVEEVGWRRRTGGVEEVGWRRRTGVEEEDWRRRTSCFIDRCQK
ncbi:hypothetical protein EYF80_064891 [Liparis tanakae]|uniref:Uncharacterized protein n=1 Tax=Liparis tanakae TaxID=230148 RepID=A0A4Z2E8I3_9TELE|nr:hypothetical protein EYF80_064891 [Liparis tanakae]